MVEPYDRFAGQGSLAFDELGVTGIPSSLGQRLGARVEESFEDAFPFFDVTRIIDEEAGVRPPPSSAWAPAADSRIAEDLAARDAETPPATLLAPEQAAERYGIPGELTWTRPVYEDVAREQRDRTQEKLARKSIYERAAGGGFLTGALEFGAGLAGGLPGIVDPFNVMTAFLPVIGPAKAAIWASRYGVLGSAAAGAIEGAAGQALMLPLQYGIAKHDQEDFGAVDALLSIAMGTAFGGGLHTGIHLFGRPQPDLEATLKAVTPEQREGLLRRAGADLAEGRPVEVAHLLDVFDTTRAERELGTWVQRQQRIERETEAVLTRASAAEERGLVSERTREATATRLDALREEQASLQAERQAALTRAETAIDPVTRERLALVQEELAASPPAARRAELEAEQRLLTEGGGPLPEADVLAQARAEAEAAALTPELQRARGRVFGTEQALERAEARAAETATVAGRSLDTEAARLASQQEVLQALTERTLWRLAGRGEAAITREEVATLAREVLAAKPAEAPAAIKAAIDAVTARGEAGPLVAPAGGAPTAPAAAPGVPPQAPTAPVPPAAAAPAVAPGAPAAAAAPGIDLGGMGGSAETGVPFMITAAMKRDLATRGYTPDQIREMTPTRAHEILSPAATPAGTVPDIVAPASARRERAMREALTRERARLVPEREAVPPGEIGRMEGDVTAPPQDPTSGLTAEQQIANAASDEQIALQNIERAAKLEGKEPPNLAADPEYQARLKEAADLEDNARALEQSGVCLSRNA